MTGLWGAIVAGAVLGMASALHCATMCGGISAGLLTLLSPHGSRAERAGVLALMQAGRISAYIVLGGAVGLMGSAVLQSGLEPKLAARLLQWAAAVSLMWIGLSVAGLVPQLAGVARGITELAAPITARLSRMRLAGGLGTYAAGVSWGLCPCPMVYGALFTAALTGSLPGGAALMAGFGLGTVPAVMASALGITSLARLNGGPVMRVGLGLAIAMLGFATVYLGGPRGELCLVW